LKFSRRILIKFLKQILIRINIVTRLEEKKNDKRELTLFNNEIKEEKKNNKKT